MNILFAPAHYYFSDKYGSEPYWAYQIVKKSAECGHSVMAIVGVDDCINSLDGYLNKIKIISVFSNDRSSNVLIESFKRFVFVFIVFWKSKSILKKNKIDVVHHLFPSSPESFNLLGLLKDFNVPFVMGPLQIPTKMGGYNGFVRSSAGKKNIFSLLSYLFYLSIRPLFRYLSKKTMENADYIFCNSSAAYEFYSKVSNFKNISVIPIGIDIEKIKIKKKKTNNIITVGYLVERKGHKFLIDAFSELIRDFPNLNLYIIGNGPELENLEEQVNKLKITKFVKFVGFVPHGKVGDYYKKSDIFVLPSLDESYGNVLLEAMSYGLPIVSTDVGSIREIIGKAGKIVNPGDSKSLYNSLKKLLLSEQIRNEYGVLARQRVENFYSWESVIREYNNIYEKLL